MLDSNHLRQLGISTILSQFILCLLASLPILYSGQLFKAISNHQLRASSIDELILLHGYGTHIVEQTEQTGVYIPPKFHSKGMLILSNNKPLFPSTDPALQVDALSDAITWIELENHIFLERDQRDPLSNHFCTLRGSHTTISKEYESFIGISVDGIFELIDLSLSTKYLKPCQEFLLAPQESILLNSPTLFSSSLINYLIPIKGIHTLYRDKNGNLRILTHQGAKILENQPVGTLNQVMRYSLYYSLGTYPHLNISLIRATDSKRNWSMSLPIQIVPPHPLDLFSSLKMSRILS